MARDEAHERAKRWWNETFAERRRAIESVYGRSGADPAAAAPARAERARFRWDDVVITGGSALTFPPAPGEADAAESPPAWSFVTLGLTQPEPAGWADEMRGGDPELSGYRAELVMLTRERADWPLLLVRQLMWYVRKHRPINPGDRMAFGAERASDGTIDANIGDQEADGVPLLGPMRGLLFWPHLAVRPTIAVSTGPFELLVATAITAPEWEFAKRLTSEHLLLLLYRCGVGQVSALSRDDVATSHRHGEDARLVAAMTSERVAGELTALAGKAWAGDA